MCTVTWLQEDGGYQVFCNRDENSSRAPALEPRVVRHEGVRFVAPLDGDFGGTWIGANEFGVTVCLLNGPAITSGRNLEPRKSRGILVTGLLNAAGVAEVRQRIARLDLSPFAPFTLAAFEPGQPASITAWDGEEAMILTNGEPCLPLTSSSVDPGGVQSARREDLCRRIRDAGTRDARMFEAFHKSHGSGPSAYSTCMHRPGAETVSFSRLRVTKEGVRLFYMPASPCKGSSGRMVTLACRSRS